MNANEISAAELELITDLLELKARGLIEVELELTDGEQRFRPTPAAIAAVAQDEADGH